METIRKPMIALTPGGTDPSETSYYPFRTLELSDCYTQAVAAAGGVPVLTAECDAQRIAERMDGLVLTGGADIHPKLYGETIAYDTVKPDEKRDAFETELARAFMAQKKPIMAICRGFQLLNAVLGGTLYQDVPEQLGFVHFDRGLRHFVRAEKGSVLHTLFGETFRVNSTHHQAVREPGRGLRVTAYSPEGIVEGYEHETLPILGTQFHPERLTLRGNDGRTPDFLPLFEHFIGMCAAGEK